LIVCAQPGDDPNNDDWKFLLFRRPFTCSPERSEAGWRFGDCSDSALSGFAENIEMFVPVDLLAGLSVSLDLLFEPEWEYLDLTLAPVERRVEPRQSDNVRLLWNQPANGTNSDIWADNGLVFAPGFDDQIELIDAASGEVLGIASIADAEGEFSITYDVKSHGDYLFAATDHKGVVVFDVSDPTSPTVIGQHYSREGETSQESFFDIHNIFLSPDGQYLYAMNTPFSPTAMWVLDVSDPANPVEAGRFSIAGDLGSVHDVNVIQRGDTLVAFLNYWEAGLYILDVTDPGDIVELGSIVWDDAISHSGWPFELDGKLYYANAGEGPDQHITILDVSDFSNPSIVSTFKTRSGISSHNIQVEDGIAYIAYYLDGLRVVDLRDPQNPKEIGHFDTVPADEERGLIQGAWGVQVVDGVTYISDLVAGTYAFEVTLD
jgi:choice-of-anchor B domain-containing protein